VDVRQIDPDDEAAFDAFYGVLHETDVERWPNVSGWTRSEVHVMASADAAASRYDCLVARVGNATVGICLLERSQRDNTHELKLDIRVLPTHRRLGIGRALAGLAEQIGREDGRMTMCHICEVPTAQLPGHPSVPFAQSLGFASVQTGHVRHLSLPVPPERREQLWKEAHAASVGYRILTFTSPWPEEFLDDQCALWRRMSTDAPHGDEQHEEEVWDVARVEEMDAMLAAQGRSKLTAVAQHEASGRLVAYSELVVSKEQPAEAWQWATLVAREHRGHRLGMAVKLANLDYLRQQVPAATLVTTGNAQENAPMIAVNDMIGFQVVATGTFWRKQLAV
jgi:GNAT superfamily N-acetyltransferase